MEIFSTVSLVILIASVIAWAFTWAKACSFLKEPATLSFFYWPNVFHSEKFRPEGDEYRKKALIFLFIQFFSLTILMLVSE